MVKDVVKMLSEKKEQLEKDLIEAAVTNHSKVTDIAFDISTISKMLDIVHVNVTPSAKPQAAQQSQAEVQKNPVGRPRKKLEEIAERNQKQEPQTVTMSDDLTNRRPVSFSFMGETYSSNSFRSLAETLCRQLYMYDTKNFMNLENIPSVNGDKHKYFSREKMNLMSDPVMIGSGANIIYVDIAKLAINNLFFMKRVCSAMGLDPKNISITLDPSFARKPRTKKDSEAE
jgi:hypothetical protein